MKYLLVEPKVPGKNPNIALLKWARWCEINNHEYQYIKGLTKPDIKPDYILISCIFTFYFEAYEKIIDKYSNMFPGVPITVGGVFPTLYPKWFNKPKWSGDKWYGGTKVTVFKGVCKDIDNLIPKYNVEIKYQEGIKPYERKRIILYASRGCVNNCKYCAVPRLEGKMQSYKSIKDILDVGMKELPDASGIVLYDNNLTEHKYLSDIIDDIYNSGLGVDISQGMHVDAFTEDKAKMFSKIKFKPQTDKGTSYIRFSFDKMKYAEHIERAYLLTRKYIKEAAFFCYMLYNFTDTTKDLWYKINFCQELVDKHGGIIYLFPMRYRPFNPTIKKFVSKNWTEELLSGFKKICNNSNGFISIYRNNDNMYNNFGYNEDEWFVKCKEQYSKTNKIKEGILTL